MIDLNSWMNIEYSLSCFLEEEEELKKLLDNFISVPERNNFFV